MGRGLVSGRTASIASIALAALFFAGTPRIHAQRGAAPPGPPPTAQASASIDITGYWESIITEDWRWRMMTPPKGDYESVTLNAEARKVADGWDPAKDEAAGTQCKAYGAAAVMRVPGRIHVTWEDANTLKIETEAGTQTRLLHFNASQPPAGEPTWQGYSAAQWQVPGSNTGARGRGRVGTTLKVVTTHMRPGYLRKNGVPYSANAVVTEYFNRLSESNGDEWLLVANFVEDPQYLTQPFATSSHFKKLPDGSKWKPEPCTAR
jgi:hypothetical protein